MKKTTLDRLPMAAATVIVVLVIAACTIPLRDNENQTTSAASSDQASDLLVTKLAECRSVTYDQTGALADCRKAWAEKRRQFLGQTAPPSSSSNGIPREGPSLFVPRKDQSRLSPDDPSIQQSGKE